MSQSEMLQFLKEHKGKWWSTREIKEELGIPRETSSVNINFMRLRKTDFIKFRMRKEKNSYLRSRKTYEYRLK